MTHHILQYWKQLARAANARGNAMEVGRIIGTKLEPLFDGDHRAAFAFYTELEQSAPTPIYTPMMGD
jgi:hypothetical protein